MEGRVSNGSVCSLLALCWPQRVVGLVPLRLFPTLQMIGYAMKMFKSLVVLLMATPLIAGCATSSVTFIKRGTNEMGTGIANGLGQTLEARIGQKTCQGEYTTVPSSGGIGLIQAHGRGPGGTASLHGTSYFQSSGGLAVGLMTCSDGDAWRCEISYHGTRGYGVCVGADDAVYDVICK